MSGYAKNAVLVVTVEDSFRPQRPWDIPAEFSEGETFTRNVPLAQACAFVLTFNKNALANGLADRRWAIAVKHAKYDSRGAIRPQAREAVEGGAQ